jgi:hypothetical protein
MIPRVYSESITPNANGKLAKFIARSRSLPEFETGRQGTRNRNPAHADSHLKETLHVQQVGIHDNFELGHSLDCHQSNEMIEENRSTGCPLLHYSKRQRLKIK